MPAREPAPPDAQRRRSSDDAIVQLCTFRIGSEDYAIDIMRVREIIYPQPITPVPRAPAFVEGVVRVRGEVIPVLDVRRRLGVAVSPLTRKSRFLVVNVAGRRIGLVVDEVCEVLRIPRGEIRPAPSLRDRDAPAFFLGVCGGESAGPGRHGATGRLRLLLNVKALLDPSVPGEAVAARAQAEAWRAREPDEAAPAPQGAPRNERGFAAGTDLERAGGSGGREPDASAPPPRRPS